MNIIKLNAINSTNTFLKGMYENRVITDCTLAVTHNQLEGRGQRNTKWVSEPNKNIALSVYKEVDFIDINNQFAISKAVSVALIEAFKKLAVPNLAIKWPNDILSCNSKIAGILIETIIKANSLNAVIVGIGINVNQTNFNALPHAGSLKGITGQSFDLDTVVDVIINELKTALSNLRSQKTEVLDSTYQDLLFKQNEESTFKNPDNSEFNGVIKGVNAQGHLKVLTQNDLKTYNLKEIALVY